MTGNSHWQPGDAWPFEAMVARLCRDATIELGKEYIMTMTLVLSSVSMRGAAHAAILSASIFGTVVSGIAAGFKETDLVANTSPLIDSNGISHNPAHVDGNLVNPWGNTASSTLPFWVADNGAGVSTLYNTAGVPQSLVVSIPAPGDPLGKGGAPTGVVFNIARAAGAFNISKGTATAPAFFLFATEDGTILGWSPTVDPTHAIIAVPKPPALPSGTVYKGLAFATDASATPTPATRLYATNFHAGTVEVFDEKFVPVTPPGAFTDPHLPKGYAPFNIVPIGDKLARIIHDSTSFFISPRCTRAIYLS
jgi:uncharacterized protein (TIGR03118 family)